MRYGNRSLRAASSRPRAPGAAARAAVTAATRAETVRPPATSAERQRQRAQSDHCKCFFHDVLSLVYRRYGSSRTLAATPAATAAGIRGSSTGDRRGAGKRLASMRRAHFPVRTVLRNRSAERRAWRHPGRRAAMIRRHAGRRRAGAIGRHAGRRAEAIRRHAGWWAETIRRAAVAVSGRIGARAIGRLLGGGRMRQHQQARHDEQTHGRFHHGAVPESRHHAQAALVRPDARSSNSVGTKM